MRYRGISLPKNCGLLYVFALLKFMMKKQWSFIQINCDQPMWHKCLHSFNQDSGQYSMSRKDRNQISDQYRAGMGPASYNIGLVLFCLSNAEPIKEPFCFLCWFRPCCEALWETAVCVLVPGELCWPMWTWIMPCYWRFQSICIFVFHVLCSPFFYSCQHTDLQAPFFMDSWTNFFSVSQCKQHTVMPTVTLM